MAIANSRTPTLATPTPPAAAGPRIDLLPLVQLNPHPDNPRGDVDPASVAELADSIRDQGILEPLIVTPTDARATSWTIVAGHRRFAAATLAGLEVAPCLVRDLSAAEQLKIMLVENIQRQDLTPLQEARGYALLHDVSGKTYVDIARELGVTGARVTSRMTILRLDPAVQALYGLNAIPTSLAPTLAKVADPQQQLRFANIAARHQMPMPRLEATIMSALGELEDKAIQRRHHAAEAAEADQPAGATRPPVSRSRQELLDKLDGEPATTIAFSDLAQCLRDTCCWCGLEDLGDVCKDCPMPKFVNRALELA